MAYQVMFLSLMRLKSTEESCTSYRSYSVKKTVDNRSIVFLGDPPSVPAGDAIFIH
jgi:hypothetical protein